MFPPVSLHFSTDNRFLEFWVTGISCFAQYYLFQWLALTNRKPDNTIKFNLSHSVTNSPGPVCINNPCRNGGICNEDARGNFSCTCKPGFTGPFCESQLGVRLCEQNPCRNDGVCLAITDNEYKCECLPGWTGKNCETNFNECSSNPCKHGGVCIDGINNYTCICDRTGYVY